MDDSDRSRDDDSAAADGSTDEAEPESDGAVDEGSEADESADSEASEAVESEVTAEVEPEVGSAGSDADGPGDERPDALSGPDEVVEAEDAGRSDALDDGSERNEESPDGAATEGDSVTADDGATADTEAAGDGGTPATTPDAATADAPTAVDDDPFEGIEGPETDEEMPLAAHIEEMMRRLAVVFLIGGLATLVVITESTELINYFWSYHIPAPMENRPRLYGPLELPLTQLKVAGLAGVVVGLPAFVYQTYRFMRPGLYETERRYYLAAVPTSLILGGVGIAFAHFLVLPAIFSYFTTYTSDAATIAFGLAETFNLIVIMLAFMAIVFQIPLFIMLAIMMNLVTRQWLEAKRLIFWGTFLGIAFLFSPDPTGMAPIIVTLTMIALFEGTLAILRWTGN
ncbi:MULTISPECIES: twin-arginine translocase subunit TatC [Halorubrum]|uniref:Sec-independent protein translocase protein TatC n=1 Tax=Halorubrum sodomense TaxID=35743 RepID=A0A1I6FK47_HALSD|nr:MULTISPECIES: twin-arginine translocase subunit TatC [Halorubrum]TKX53383.1 MFS transporter [Halorubrum sp. SP3]TKX67629.1 MFS transporter [Halorubrum sp. SP9]SFR30319.1 sec-independent protein translocase protein TatC [Halorubrum sodomense]